MKKNCFLAIAILALSTTVVNAQYIKSKDLLEKGKHKRKKKTDNIVKIAPLGFVTGAFPIYFERRINNFFTVQVGAGLTGKNHLRGAIQNAAKIATIHYPWGNNNTGYDDNDAAEELFGFDFRKASMGYMFSIQPRLYFDSEAPDGAYVGLSYDYYRHKFTIPGIVVQGGEAVHNGSTKKEHENLNDVMVYFGYHAIFDHLTLDASGGLGLRSGKGIKYAALFDQSSGQITNEGYADYSQKIFSFGIALRVGYHF